jgi:hypothetical protein
MRSGITRFYAAKRAPSAVCRAKGSGMTDTQRKFLRTQQAAGDRAETQ